MIEEPGSPALADFWHLYYRGMAQQSRRNMSHKHAICYVSARIGD
jgi:hypothetical protein